MGRHKCIVPGCTNRPTDNKGGVRRAFHTFPQEEDRRQQWIIATKARDGLPESARVCSDHFSEEDYVQPRLTRWHLKKTAVPHLNLGEEDEGSPPEKRARIEEPEECGTHEEPQPSTSEQQASTKPNITSYSPSAILALLTMLSIAVQIGKDVHLDHAYTVPSPENWKKRCQDLQDRLARRNKEYKLLSQGEFIFRYFHSIPKFS